MRPSDRTIRDELRREAANVPVPDMMWQHISRKLDEDGLRRKRRLQWLLQGAQWRPTIILAVTAGFFWFALIPALPHMETMSGTNQNRPMTTAATTRDTRSKTLGTENRPNDEPEKVAEIMRQRQPVKPFLHFPSVPQ